MDAVGTVSVMDAPPFDLSKLSDFLQREVANFGGLENISVFKGGQSNPTYLIDSQSQRYVLRKKPPGKLLPSAHAVDREHRVMSALAQRDFPVPTMHCLCKDRGVIGTEFYVMEYLDGRIFWSAEIPEVDAKDRGAYYTELTQVLAQLHSIPYDEIGLSDYGKPGNYFARQIGRWSKQYKASELEHNPAMHGLMEWLPNNIPEGDETRVVHGDYRLDNVIFHPTEPKIIAVLDWELSTLGHPLSDFSYFCMNWRLPTGLGNSDLSALSIPTEDDVIRQYCDLTGRDGISNWSFYLIFNLFRIAAILQGVAARAAQGNASNEQAAKKGALAKPISEYAWSLVE